MARGRLRQVSAHLVKARIGRRLRLVLPRFGFGDDIDRPAARLAQGASNILADDAENQQLRGAQDSYRRHQRRPADHRMVDPKEADDRIDHQQATNRRKDQRQMNGVAQRPHAVSDDAGDREIDHAAIGELALALAPRALAISDCRHRHAEPAHQPAQEQVLILETVDGLDCAAVEQKEIGAARLDAHVADGIEQAIEQARRHPLGRGRAVAVLAPGHHDLGAGAPMLDQSRHRLQRMLEVAVQHHRGGAAGVAQPGAQGRLMAEIAAERDIAHVRMALRQRADLGQRAVGRAVIDEDDFEAAERARDVRQPRRNGRDVLHLVMGRQDKRDASGVVFGIALLVPATRPIYQSRARLAHPGAQWSVNGCLTAQLRY